MDKPPADSAAKRKAPSEAERRAARLAEALRANLQKRKQQGRARRRGAEDATEGLPAASPDGEDGAA